MTFNIKTMKKVSKNGLQIFLRLALFIFNGTIFYVISMGLIENYTSSRVIVTSSSDILSDELPVIVPLIVICAKTGFKNGSMSMLSFESYMLNSKNITESIQDVYVTGKSMGMKDNIHDTKSYLNVEDLFTLNGHCTSLRFKKKVEKLRAYKLYS